MEEANSKPNRKQFKTSNRLFHIDITQLQTSQGKLYMFVAIDRTSKLALVKLLPSTTKMQAAAFLNKLNSRPFLINIHTILTDNGIQPTNRKGDRQTFDHIFTRNMS